MSFKNIIGIVLFLSVLTSCDKYLDVEPKGIVIPKRFEEFDGILNSETNTNSFPDHMAYLSDDLSASFSPISQDPFANAYFWKEIIDDNNDNSPAIWGTLYRQIYNTNIIINNVQDVSDANEGQKNHLLGEALAERAFAHFNLLTVFAKAYDPSTADQLPGVPWVDYTDVVSKTPDRSTLQTTLNLIIDDLKAAENYLSSSRLNKTRINKAVAQAILSRVYLYMGDFDEAQRYANLALQEPHEIIDYNFYYFPEQEEDPEILLLRTSTEPSLIFDLTYSNDLLKIFSPGDLRMDLFAFDFDGNYMRAENGIFAYSMYGIRFSELMLTKAEALAHLGRLNDALEVLNELRQLRIEASIYEPLFSNDISEVMDWILAERRRELAFGSSRWMDMKRLAHLKLGASATRYSADLQEIVTIDPSSYSFTYEIPSRVLMFNPDMETNF